jgi:hypothetical protein
MCPSLIAVSIRFRFKVMGENQRHEVSAKVSAVQLLLCLIRQDQGFYSAQTYSDN